LNTIIDKILTFIFSDTKNTKELYNFLGRDNSYHKKYYFILDSIGNSIDFEESDFTIIQQRIKQRKRNRIIKRLSVAASLALFIVLGTLSLLNFKTNDYINQISQSSRILYLEDGTKIYLKPNTVINVPSDFSINNRSVQLIDGEAYFEVTHLPESKFKVSSSDYEVEVLGTKFNIRAYSNEKYITTSLKTGKVRINYDENEIAVLNPNEKLIYNKISEQFRVAKYSNEVSYSWKKDLIRFDDIKLSKVLKNLAIHYNLRIDIGDSILDTKINGTFNCSSIEYLLNVLNQLEDFNYKIDSNKIVVSIDK
jgi:ferric-dicitrate binding protein FerR (iron transport regulator)